MEQRIDVQNERELRYWCEKLRASEEELRRAVDQVGSVHERRADLLTVAATLHLMSPGASAMSWRAI